MTAASPAQEAMRAPATEEIRRQRIYILPTAQGLGYACVLLVMLVGTINYDNSLGYALTFLLTSVGLTSTLYTHHNLSGLLLRPGASGWGFAGTDCEVGLLLENRAGAARPGLVVVYRNGLRGRGRKRLGYARLSLAAGQTRSVALKLHAPQRGWLRLQGLTLATRFPFGLFRAWSPVALDLACIVYPRPEGEPRLPRSGRMAADGEQIGGADGDDFCGLREYQRGDSPRSIHWRAAAKGAGLPVKQFSGNVTEDIWLDWQLAGGAAEQRISQLARWVIEADRQRLRYGLRLPDGVVDLDVGPAHFHACLTRLALLDVA